MSSLDNEVELELQSLDKKYAIRMKFGNLSDSSLAGRVLNLLILELHCMINQHLRVLLPSNLRCDVKDCEGILRYLSLWRSMDSLLSTIVSSPQSKSANNYVGEFIRFRMFPRLNFKFFCPSNDHNYIFICRGAIGQYIQRNADFE